MIRVLRSVVLAAALAGALLTPGAAAARDTVTGEDSAGLVHQAQAALAAGRAPAAADLYTRAVALDPRSEDLWVGLQRAQLLLGRYRRAAEAGEHALRINPRNLLARRGQAWARFQLGEYEAARGLYASVLAEEPDDGEMHLGLGLSLVRLGRVDDGKAACRAAGVRLRDDARVAACLATRSPLRPDVWASASATLLTFAGSAFGADLSALSFAAGAHWAWGAGFWLGVSLSETSFVTATSDYRQATPVLGLTLQRAGWDARLGMAWVFSTEDSIDGTAVLLGRLGYGRGALGGRLDVAVSLYPSFRVTQLDPMLEWSPARWVTLGVGGSASVIQRAGYTAEVRASLRLATTFRLPRSVTLGLSGFYGEQRYHVDAGGLSVWTGSDRWVGGYRVALSYAPAAWVSLYGELEHGFGDQQLGVTQDFQTIGGTLGVRFIF